ncbi:MAG: esterase, partial [Dermabacter sp.]|nr:esterase [Dermabacter sp.]
PVHLSVGTKDLFLTDSRIVTHQFEREEVELTYREIPGKISVNPRLRRGADMARLLEEQREFLEANLAETPGK